MGSGKGLLSAGWTPYHGLKLVVPLLAAISPMFYEKYIPESVFGGHHVIKSLSYGVLTAGFTYLLMGIIKEKSYRLQKAVLLGLLVSELTIFHADDKIPSIVMISFMLFMYLIALGVDGVHDEY